MVTRLGGIDSGGEPKPPVEKGAQHKRTTFTASTLSETEASIRKSAQKSSVQGDANLHQEPQESPEEMTHHGSAIRGLPQGIESDSVSAMMSMQLLKLKLELFKAAISAGNIGEAVKEFKDDFDVLRPTSKGVVREKISPETLNNLKKSKESTFILKIGGTPLYTKLLAEKYNLTDGMILPDEMEEEYHELMDSLKEHVLDNLEAFVEVLSQEKVQKEKKTEKEMVAEKGVMQKRPAKKTVDVKEQVGVPLPLEDSPKGKALILQKKLEAYLLMKNKMQKERKAELQKRADIDEKEKAREIKGEEVKKAGKQKMIPEDRYVVIEDKLYISKTTAKSIGEAGATYFITVNNQRKAVTPISVDDQTFKQMQTDAKELKRLTDEYQRKMKGK